MLCYYPVKLTCTHSCERIYSGEFMCMLEVRIDGWMDEWMGGWMVG